MTTNVVAYYGETPLKSGTLLAPADWSGLDTSDGFSYQFRGVTLSTSVQNTAALVSSSVSGPGLAGVGILTNAPKSGEACQLVVIGETKCLAGAAIANIGTILMFDTSGRVIAATSGKVGIGFNMMPANAAGDIITCFVCLLNFAAGK